jgi:RNA polymerase sigma factor (TIGR02999 family)
MFLPSNRSSAPDTPLRSEPGGVLGGDRSEPRGEAHHADAAAQSNAELFATLYDELHRLAERQLRRDGAGAALSTTTLVHEVYLDLSSRAGADFPDRARFIGYAARAMRGIVIDHVRYSRAAKRGGGALEITLTGSLDVPAQQTAPAELERLSEALDALATVEPSLAELVDLHFFCGYELREIAELKGVSERTMQRSWQKARLLLRHQMIESANNDASGASG